MTEADYGFSTKAVRAGEQPDPTTGAVVPPIYQTNTYFFRSAEEGAAIFAGEREGFVYARYGNPTQATLERRTAALEGGEAALATASGMAAVTTAIFAIAKKGDHIVSADSLYSGTYDFFSNKLPSLGIEVTLVDATDPSAFQKALRENTVAIYMETPGNPTLAVTDIAAVVEIAKSAGVMTLIDNTFATPYNQRPLELGVDVVIHSATKYLGGHGDTMAGVIVGSKEFIERNSKLLRVLGGVISPFNAWLILRGIPTLPLRMERHNSNALEVAHFLENHPKVERVIYPGLPSHPQYEVARKQMKGFGGMVCFEVKGGLEAGRRLMNSVKLCTLAVSLGDNRSLICHPASMTHASMSPEGRLAVGISDGLIRFSVGTEDIQDIIRDLSQALD